LEPLSGSALYDLGRALSKVDRLPEAISPAAFKKRHSVATPRRNAAPIPVVPSDVSLGWNIAAREPTTAHTTHS